jgi:predicted transposase/invertase (TIGR01784 family)
MTMRVGDAENESNRIAALTITDFEVFQDFREYRLRFIDHRKELLMNDRKDSLELVFLELPKFNRTPSESVALMDKGVFFLKNATRLTKIPSAMIEFLEICQAFETAREVNLTPLELDLLEKEEWFIYEERHLPEQAAQRAKLQEEAFERGKERVREKARYRIAQNCLPDFDDAMIRRLTGLSLETTQQLRNEVTKDVSKSC